MIILSRRGSCTCTHPTHCCTLGSEANFWSLARLRAYLLLYHSISHDLVSHIHSFPFPRPPLFSCRIPLFLSIPYYTVDSSTSLLNGRVMALIHRPSGWAALPCAAITYNSKCCSLLATSLHLLVGTKVSSVLLISRRNNITAWSWRRDAKFTGFFARLPPLSSLALVPVGLYSDWLIQSDSIASRF